MIPSPIELARNLERLEGAVTVERLAHAIRRQCQGCGVQAAFDEAQAAIERLGLVRIDAPGTDIDPRQLRHVTRKERRP